MCINALNKIDDSMFGKSNTEYYSLSISEDRDMYYYLLAKHNHRDTEFLVEKRTRSKVEFLNECSVLSKFFKAHVVYDNIDSHIIDFIKSGNITSATSSYMEDILNNSINFKTPAPRTMIIGDEENYLDKNVLDKLVPARPTKK